MNINAILVSIIPSIGLGLLFWYVMRTVIRADRNERAAIAAQEAASRPSAPLPSTSTSAGEPPTGNSAE